MAQLKDDCFAFDGPLLPVDAALAELTIRLDPIVRPVRLPLASCHQRFLVHDLISQETVPPTDNSAVDGFAVYFDDLNRDSLTTLPVIGRAAAGHPFTESVQHGQAIQIFTGASMPDGPDTVMMSEDCDIKIDTDGDVTSVQIAPGIKRGSNCRPAGEDIKSGHQVLPAGQRLRPQDIGMIAAAGFAVVEVNQPLRVALLSTGDELREPGTSPRRGSICDSNRHGLRALLEGAGCEVTDLGILTDDESLIQDSLRQASVEHDLVVSSGGMSVGKEDHVKSAVEKLGSLFFWRLAVKPGRPIAFGQINDAIFVGLPGNPAAALVTFLTIVRPLLYHLQGSKLNAHRFSVKAGFTHKKKADRREWVRVSLDYEADASQIARKFERDGAGILSSLVESDGLVELPEDLLSVKPGYMLNFLPFSEALK
jgi:molybdopterin molybdotransferase